jgi:PAS domain S-box-containing protein
VHAADGSIIYANEAACEILRLDSKTFLPKPSPSSECYLAPENGSMPQGERYPPSGVVGSREPMRNVITGVRATDEDHMRWFSMNSEPCFDEQTGLLKEVIVTLVDVTALKKVEEALRLSEDKFATAFNSSPDAINLNRVSDGLYLDVNKAFTDLTGYSRGDVIGKSSLELDIWRHPEDRATLVRGLRENGEYLGLEAEFQKKNGEVSTGLMSARITNVEGEPCIISVTRNITEQRRAEEARRLFEAQVEAQKRQFYRNTILSVTGGKLLICDDADVEPYLSGAEVLFDVRRPEDVHSARHNVEGYCRGHGLSGVRLDEFMLAVGECITNAIKHGVYGRVHAGHTDGSVWVGVADEGKGIESLILPQAVLRQGFSTKPSLGLGYTIMLDASDSLMLSTGDSGTKVVLIKDIAEREIDFGLSGIPDTWD